MKTTAMEIQVPERETDISEQFIQPENPEQPLIRVSRNVEKDRFEGVFALELTGIGRRGKNREDKKKDEIFYDSQQLFKNCVHLGLSDGQTLEFVYAGGKDQYNKTRFHWSIRGRSETPDLEHAVRSSRNLWENLSMVTGALGPEYAFSPVNENEKLTKDLTKNEWIGTIKPAGAAIAVKTSTSVGLIRESDREVSRVIIAPRQDAASLRLFDSFVLACAGLAFEVTLLVSIKKKVLSQAELRKADTALKELQYGEAKQLRFPQAYAKRIDTQEIRLSLEAELALWVKNPAGYEIEYRLASDRPIPPSLLALIGYELIPGPFTTEIVRKYEGNICSFRSTAEKNVLDLSSCVNIASILPPLFPSIESLQKCNVKRSYANTEIDMQRDGILLGKIGESATAKLVRFSSTDRNRHAYIIGSTGTGKSTLLLNMIKQDIDNGEGVCLIDPHGDLHQQVLRAVPKSRAEDVVIVDPSDFDNAVGINFMETGDFNKSMQMNFAVNELIKIFDRLFDLRTTGGPIFEQYMRNAMLLLMDNTYTGATLCDIPLLFEDQEFRMFLKKGCKSPLVESFWTLMAERAGGDASLVNVAPYITSKLSPFVYNALLRPIIGQPKSTINFREIMDKRQILLVNLSKGVLGEMDTQLLGMIIIGKIFSAAMGRVSMRPEDRKPFYLYVDEFQNFTTDSVAFLLSEARKFNISLTLANQNLAQLRSINGHQNILDAVLGNVGSMFMLRMGVNDSDTLKLYTKPDIDAQDLQNLQDFNVAARLMSRNAPTKPFVFTTLPAGKDGSDDLASEIRTLSANKYTRITKLVEKEIVARRTAYKKANEQQVVNA